MNIALLGYGLQGKSAFEYWNTPDNQITICDANTQTDIPAGAEAQLGPDYLNDLSRFELLVRTPRLHPRDIVMANANNSQILDKVWSNTNEFIKVCPSKNIIGVTGTKGKGTTSTLIAEILKSAGKRVHLGGNIGIPPLEMLKNDIQPEDWIVLELANFQLIDLKQSPPIAVCLMVEPEHLDWHKDYEEYVDTKQQLFINQSERDTAIYYAKNKDSGSIAGASPGTHIPFFEAPGAEIIDNTVTIDGNQICSTSEIALPGEHNWQNVCAAVTATWQITQDVEAIRKTIKSFKGLPYRIEFRAEKNGIRYFNDSFATAPGATIAAIKAIEGPKVMILGGFERNLKMDELVDAMKKPEHNVRGVALIGQSADRLASLLDKNAFPNYRHVREHDMNAIVTAATELAEPGDSVILSPSFASFDMFKNFEHRGEAFNEAVEAL